MARRRDELTRTASIKEIKQLLSLATQTYIAGWIVNLHEYLSDPGQQAMELQSELDDLAELLKRANSADFGPESRRKIAHALKRLISFNNESRREKDDFEKVGVGWCVEAIGGHCNAIKRANKIITKQQKRQ
jgi:hypothetical protein